MRNCKRTLKVEVSPPPVEGSDDRRLCTSNLLLKYSGVKKLLQTGCGTEKTKKKAREEPRRALPDDVT